MNAREKLKAGSKSLRDLRAFFNSIPKDKWCKHQFQLGDKCCARGHFLQLTTGSATASTLDDEKFYLYLPGNYMNIVDVNNNAKSDLTIKEEVIEFLDEHIHKRFKPK